MKASEMIEKIKDLLGIELSSQEAEAIELAQTTLENGTIIEYESLEAGSPVFIVTEDEKIALPAGEYTLEDGRILLVVDEGEISEVKEATEEDQAEEEDCCDDCPRGVGRLGREVELRLRQSGGGGMSSGN